MGISAQGKAKGKYRLKTLLEIHIFLEMYHMLRLGEFYEIFNGHNLKINFTDSLRSCHL